MLVPWTALQPSLRARRWRRAGQVIALTACTALFLAALASDPFDRRLLILACGVAAICWWATRQRPPRKLEVGVSMRGEIRLRTWAAVPLRASSEPHAESLAAEFSPVDISFAAPWLISLRSGTMLVPIWPDCLPPTVYRQLWVHLHWGRAAPRDDDRKTTSTRDRFVAR